MILLAGISASDLEHVLEFVYRGEVSVDPNQLPSLLQTAHCLNIHGLTIGANSNAAALAAATSAGMPLHPHHLQVNLKAVNTDHRY